MKDYREAFEYLKTKGRTDLCNSIEEYVHKLEKKVEELSNTLEVITFFNRPLWFVGLNNLNNEENDDDNNEENDDDDNNEQNDEENDDNEQNNEENNDDDNNEQNDEDDDEDDDKDYERLELIIRKHVKL